MSVIHIYKGTVTAAGTDGQLVSEDGTYTNPIVVNSDADGTESAVMTFAVRANTGLKNVEAASLAVSGTNHENWCLSKNNVDWSAYGFSLAFNIGEITDGNTLFYAKTKVPSSTDPQVFHLSFDLLTKAGPA